MEKIVEKHRRSLPHLQLEGQIISLTWRLAFTLPQTLLDMQDDLKETLAKIGKQKHLDAAATYSEYVKMLQDYDAYLGKFELAGISLTEDAIASMLASAFRFYDSSLYELHSYCLMPNHVHLLIRPLLNGQGGFHQTSAIVQRLKSFTAKRIDAHLGRRGKVWQADYFDRFIRNPADYLNVVKYILDNPLKAGLVKRHEEWKHAYYKPGLI